MQAALDRISDSIIKPKIESFTQALTICHRFPPGLVSPASDARLLSSFKGNLEVHVKATWVNQANLNEEKQKQLT